MKSAKNLVKSHSTVTQSRPGIQGGSLSSMEEAQKGSAHRCGTVGRVECFRIIEPPFA